MTQFVCLNPDEMQALQGLTLEARVLYVFELRRYVDVHGITGKARRHSYQSFKEQLTVIPDAKSTRKPEEITEKKIRVVLAELERHKLIQKQKEPLVFCLPLAIRDKSVQNMRGGENEVSGADRRADSFPTAATVTGVKTGDEGRDEGREKQGMKGAHHHNTTTTTKSDFRQKISLTLDWQPSAQFQQRAMMQGVLSAKITPEAIGGFICHYESKPTEEQQTLTQSQWENLLVKWIKREKPITASTTPSAYQPKRPAIDEPRMNIPIYVPEPPKERVIRPKTTALSDIFKH